MKRLFTILTIVALTTTASFAQFSAKAGFNLSNIVSNDDDVDNGPKIGIIIGGNYEMEVSDQMSLDISAAYKMSGAKETSEYSSSSSSGTYKDETSLTVALNYLDISPSLSFNVSDVIDLSFGPYLAFALSGKFKGENTQTISGTGTPEDGSTTTTYEESIDFGDGDNDDGVKPMDFGLNIGAKYSINDAMSISAGYSLGLMNLMYIDDEDKEYYEEQGEDIPYIKNSGLFLTFGYSF